MRFTGTGTLIRHALRRERVMLPIWMLAIVGLAAAMPGAFKGLYSGPGEIEALAESMNRSTSMLILLGKAYAPTIGGLVSWRYAVLGAVPVVLMVIFMVVRHTRREEENGRLELVESTVVGRYAPTAAAVLLGWGSSLAVVVLVGLSVGAQGADIADGSITWAGSFALGFSLGLTGFVFTSITALVSQFASGARAAVGVSSAIFAFAYVIRGIADTSESLSWLAWLSPIGWAELLRPFAGNVWGVAVLAVVVALVLAAACIPILNRRDLGAGLFADKLGPEGSTMLASPLAVAWRIERTTVVGWLVAIALYGLMVGSVVDSITDFTVDSPEITQIMESMGGQTGIVNATLVAMGSMLAVAIAAFAMQAILRLTAEESAGRTESVLATSVSRTRWLGAFTGVAVAGVLASLVVSGAVIGVMHGIFSKDFMLGFTDSMGTMFVQLPSILVFCGLAMALYGWLPRWGSLSWAALGVAFMVGQFGDLLKLPDWVQQVSPFAHSSVIPGGDFDVLSALILLAIAAVLGAAGFIGLRRRDLIMG